MEAVFTKSHDRNMADGEEVVIADPRNKFISNSRNPPASKRTRTCSACLGPPHDISSSERYVQAPRLYNFFHAQQSAFEDQSFYKLQIFNVYMWSYINIPDLLSRA